MQRLILICLATFFLSALAIRVYKLDAIPAGLNRDEASIGYTAYSLSKYGIDEYGYQFPLSFKSFGDWKLPLYIYLSIISTRLIGLNEFAVRFPSALAGSLTVIIVYFLASLLFKDKKTPLLSSLVFALTPWSFFFSRNGSESNVGVFLLASGITLFFLGMKKSLYFIPSFILLTLTLYTYHAFHIFTPLICLGLIFFYRKKVTYSKHFFLGVTIAFILAVIIVQQTLLVADKTKISGLFPTSNKSLIHENISLKRAAYEDPSNLLARVLYNKPSFTLKYIIQGYLKGLSPEFWVISAGQNLQHNLPKFGNLHLWQAPFIIFGLLALFLTKHPHRNFLVYWLLISPIAPSLTVDAPHTSRMVTVVPLSALLTAYGIIVFFTYLNKHLAKLTVYLLAFVVAIAGFYNTLGYFEDYYKHFPIEGAAVWGAPYKELAAKLEKYQDKYPEVVVSRPDYSPYIYYLFYNKVDPLYFVNNAKRYPDTSEGFSHIEWFENLHFRQINWAYDGKVPNKIYLDWAESIPHDATNSAILVKEENIEILQKNNRDIKDLQVGDIILSEIVDTIKLPNGDPYFYFIATRKITK